ncbi:MAG: hypothetical protein H0X46_01070 [Bacteroidetes bacterium]|nr:hypothetical protein [Bacteroidota bacterium]
MNFRYFIFFILVSFASSFAIAQPTLDTMRMYLKQKPHLFGKFDTRNSFIDGGRAKVWGIKTGVSYGKRLYFGVGYNQFSPPSKDFDKEIYIVNTNNELEKITATLRMFYISVHVEYVFYQTKRWHLSMPLQFGIGQVYYKYTNLGKRKVIEKDYNFVYEPAVSLEYKFVKWAGVGADIGYRFMLTDYSRLNQKFTSPIYAFKFILYYNEIVKSIFPKSKLAKRM